MLSTPEAQAVVRAESIVEEAKPSIRNWDDVI
jgi:hypothetical protein